MGHKVNPKSFRLGILYSWDSRWYANKHDYANLFLSDLQVKKAIKEKLKNADVTRIEIERSAKKVTLNVYAAKPGMIIGRQGMMIDDLKAFLHKKFGQHFEVNIHEVHDPDLSALLLGQMIAAQLERRIAYRRAVKLALQKALEAGAKGVKIRVSGRLNGIEIARTEIFKEGNVPAHTLRADIDYAQSQAFTAYGAIGIKVWVYKGLVFKKKQALPDQPAKSIQK